MMVLPSTVATVVMPPALVAVIPFIAVTIAVDRSRCVDHRRWGLVDDRGRCDIDGAGHTQKNANVGVGESRAGGSRCGGKVISVTARNPLWRLPVPTMPTTLSGSHPRHGRAHRPGPAAAPGM